MINVLSLVNNRYIETMTYNDFLDKASRVLINRFNADFDRFGVYNKTAEKHFEANKSYWESELIEERDSYLGK